MQHQEIFVQHYKSFTRIENLYLQRIHLNLMGHSLMLRSDGEHEAVMVNDIGTYYIYSFDGKLLPEYDQSGNCVRDYI